MKETNNVCNMPEVASIIIHRSDDTGRYYVEFINHGLCEVESLCKFGLWTEKRITKKKSIFLMKYLCNKEDAE